MQFKKIIKSIIKLLTIILLFSTIRYSNAETEALVTDKCEVKSQFYECLEANWFDKNWVKTWSTPMNRMIDEYICISEDNHIKILENIILDTEFKKVEEWMDNFLNSLANNKEYYFTEWSKNNEIIWIEDITKIFSNIPSEWSVMWFEYWAFYENFWWLCQWNEIFEKIMECKWSIPNIEALSTIYASWEYNECMRLAETKLAIYENIAQNLLKINKGKVKEDNIDIYNKELNKQYDDLFKMFIINVDYMWAILNNWTSKTRKCFWG